MEQFLIACAGAFWLGILTSVSPCPLATNIAAIGYIGKEVDRPYKALLRGLLYTLGRSLAYFFVALIVVVGVTSIPAVSNLLQLYMNRIIGPILVIAGLLLLQLIPLPQFGTGFSDGMRKRVDKMGHGGALLLGVLFALSFCPLSAALFFGSLIPLAIEAESSVLMPGLYGVGTALPVVAFSVVLAFFANKLSSAFNHLTRIERIMRWLTAIVFFSVGAYYTLSFTLRLL